VAGVVAAGAAIGTEVVKGCAAAFESVRWDERIFLAADFAGSGLAARRRGGVMPQDCGISRSPGWTRPVS
jgi:hypothetical protein